MSEEFKWDKIGNEIRSAVQNSLETGDFSQLGGTVAETVAGVVNEAKRQASAAQDTYVNTRRSWEPQFTNVPSHREKKISVSKQPPAVRVEKKGNVAGVLYIVFGSIGIGCVCVALLVLLILTAIFHTTGLYITDVILLLSLFGFSRMLKSGCSLRGRLKRANRYVELCNGKRYINISDLSRHSGRSIKYVLKDIKTMLRTGIYPEGHLDEKEQCLMLDDVTYREYLEVERGRKEQMIPEQTANAKKKKSGAEGAGEEDALLRENPQLAAMVRQGNEYILRLRNMNDRIEGEVISAKLFTLENILREIFDRVKSHPEQMSKMQKFMDYYLPTSLKLVEAYKEFDSVSSPGEDIIKAKYEIEKTLDTINESFEELRNQLFLDSVFDATTDAQVLQTMLAKEGLAREKVFEPRR